MRQLLGDLLAWTWY